VQYFKVEQLGDDRFRYWRWYTDYPTPVGSSSLDEWRQRESIRTGEKRTRLPNSDLELVRGGVTLEMGADGTWRQTEHRESEEALAPPPLLYASDAWVGIVVRRAVDGWGEITLFGCVEREDASPDSNAWKYAKPVLRIDAAQGVEAEGSKVALPEQLRVEMALLRRWYRPLLGRPLGRPLGSRSAEPTAREVEVYLEARRRLDPADRTARGIAPIMSRILGLSITHGWVDYWMDQGVFKRDPGARRRNRRPA
jgi:hypothetical protein